MAEEIEEELEHEPPLHSEVQPLAERLIFNNRLVVLVFLVLFTGFMGYQASQIKPSASFEKMIPLKHPYIANMMFNLRNLSGLGNNIDISVEVTQGDIFTKEYMETLRLINDEVFYLPGVDRGGLKSLWTSNVRWLAVTEEGFRGGPVIPGTYEGTREQLEELRQNILRSGEVGRIVANNYKSTIIRVPLMAINPETGKPLDYRNFSHKLEQDVRDKYQQGNIEIHIIGFAKKIGDLIDGATVVGIFFLGAVSITLVLLYLYSRCPRATLVTTLCSVVAVIWQLGLINLLGYGIDPYSMLIPFLVFAIAVSHGVQIVSAMAHEAVDTPDSLTAARYAFRGLYVAGVVALASDAFGFTTLLLIEIDVIKELAIAATVGISVILFTNIIMLPILMSYVGISKGAIAREKKAKEHHSKFWGRLSYMIHPMVIPVSMVLMLCGFGFGMWYGQYLKIGDLDHGAPELWPDSRYNLDNKFITENYSVSSDVFVVMAITKEQQCTQYPFVEGVSRLMWHLKNVEGVQDAASLALVAKLVSVGLNEGNPKWYNISRDQTTLNGAMGNAQELGLMNGSCDFAPVIFFLQDHKAETLTRVIDATIEFQEQYNPTPEEEEQIAQCKVTKEPEVRPELEATRDGKIADYEQRVVEEIMTREDADKAIKEANEQFEYDLYRALYNACDMIRYQLVAGNAGVEGATNEEIAVAQVKMLILVYSVVSVMVLLTFRSFVAVIAIIVPLYLTSVLCNALMVFLEMGVKVATLPVIAVGVGIGVDYGIYIYTRMRDFLQMGIPIQEAYYDTLKTTGKAVMFTAVTLAIGVGTWAWSPIKFQADMGILLTFMFVWNMVGSITLLPALARLLINPEKMVKPELVKQGAKVSSHEW